MNAKIDIMRNDLKVMSNTIDLLHLKINAIMPSYIQLQEKFRMALKTMPYDEYLETPEWQVKRLRAIENAQGKCQECGASGVELHVHHLTYERRGEELPEDLMVLCKTCHKKVHQVRRNGI